MRQVARTIHLIGAVLLVAAVVAQVWLAGRGVFQPSTGFDMHRNLGYTIEGVVFLLFVVGLLGGMGRRAALLAAGIFGLMILQSIFVVLRTSTPDVAALHPVNGFLILLLSILLARESWTLRSSATTPTPGAT